MTQGNSILNHAKHSVDTDEWYTTYETIEEELMHYEKHFHGKVVLCNCDDPYESNFAYYFMRHFNKLKLKKLICTSFSNSKIASLKGNSHLSVLLQDCEGRAITSAEGYVLTLTKLPGKENVLVSDKSIKETLKKKGVIKRLSGNGDFRTKECLQYLKQCDICCTNPPFSLFATLFSLLIQYEKKYLLIGNQNAITYKEIFPHIKENKAWVGYKFGDMAFRVPPDTEPRKTRFWIDGEGQKWRSLGNAMWLTNLDIPKRHKDLDLEKSFDPSKYLKYDNFDAIDVPRVADIPADYDGIMGVPITFLKYHNGKQFEIIGEANHGSDNEFDLFKPIIEGKEVFKRILIKRKKSKNEKKHKI